MLLLSGALATVMVPTGCSDNQEPPPPPPDKVVGTDQLKDDRDLENNAYTPGLGYYHAVHHMWYPYPFNWYYPGRGYYYGGYWHPSVYSGTVVIYSRPSAASYLRARTYVQRSSTLPSRTYSKPSSHSSTPVRSAPITRGGFGGSSHFGGS